MHQGLEGRIEETVQKGRRLPNHFPSRPRPLPFSLWQCLGFEFVCHDWFIEQSLCANEKEQPVLSILDRNVGRSREEGVSRLQRLTLSPPLVNASPMLNG